MRVMSHRVLAPQTRCPELPLHCSVRLLRPSPQQEVDAVKAGPGRLLHHGLSRPGWGSHKEDGAELAWGDSSQSREGPACAGCALKEQVGHATPVLQGSLSPGREPEVPSTHQSSSTTRTSTKNVFLLTRFLKVSEKGENFSYVNALRKQPVSQAGMGGCEGQPPPPVTI